jgi:hypothetical protein
MHHSNKILTLIDLFLFQRGLGGGGFPPDHLAQTLTI